MTRDYVQDHITEYLNSNKSACTSVEVKSNYLDDGMLSLYVACEINSNNVDFQRNGKLDINLIDKEIDHAINNSINHFAVEYNDTNDFQQFIESSIDELKMTNPNLLIKSQQYFY